MDKKILDVTCGARSIWFDKHHPAAVYCDKRREQYHHLWKNAGNCTLDINPDVVCDFTDLPFPDNSFPLVVFDPPHLTGAKETAWLVKKYGKLDETWPKMLHDGFRECMRVLKPDGVLIFKWSEYDIPAAEVWKAIGKKPLFGHHSGKQSRTFWACFMKLEAEHIGKMDTERIAKAMCIVGKALRPVSREQVEKVWTAEWTVDEFGHKCSKCGEYLPDGEDVRKPQFCPECGRAMMDEAVQMVMERLEELSNGKG